MGEAVKIAQGAVIVEKGLVRVCVMLGLALQHLTINSELSFGVGLKDLPPRPAIPLIATTPEAFRSVYPNVKFFTEYGVRFKELGADRRHSWFVVFVCGFDVFIL